MINLAEALKKFREGKTEFIADSDPVQPNVLESFEQRKIDDLVILYGDYRKVSPDEKSKITALRDGLKEIWANLSDKGRDLAVRKLQENRLLPKEVEHALEILGGTIVDLV